MCQKTHASTLDESIIIVQNFCRIRLHATERVKGKRNEAKVVLVTDLLVRLDVVVVEQLKGRQGTRLSIIPVLQKSISSRGGDSDPSALLLHGATAIHALNERRRRHGVVAHALLNHQLEAFAQLPAGWPLERVVPPGIFDKLPQRLRPRLCTNGGFKIIVSSKKSRRSVAPPLPHPARELCPNRASHARTSGILLRYFRCGSETQAR